MIKNAVDLAKELDVDFVHLQKSWTRFIIDHNKSPAEILSELRVILTKDEIDFLIYIGLDAISNNVNDALHGLSNLIEAVHHGA